MFYNTQRQDFKILENIMAATILSFMVGSHDHVVNNRNTLFTLQIVLLGMCAWMYLIGQRSADGEHHGALQQPLQLPTLACFCCSPSCTVGLALFK